MATVITEDCINCGACEPECPNTAIYQGGVQWELDGQQHAAISENFFYIVPEKCTECVGFYDHEACAAVCPVDCCIPDPKIPETEGVLLERAKKLHPEVTFDETFPSRFRKGEAPAPSVGNGHAAEAAVAAVAPASVEAKPAAAAPTPAPATAATQPVRRVERPLAPPPRPVLQKAFAGELSEDFDALVKGAKLRGSRIGFLGKMLVVVLQPVLGALTHRTKEWLELAVGNRTVFSNSRATGLNILQNMILYPVIAVAAAWLLLDGVIFSSQMKWWIFLGVCVATVESIWRLGDGFFRAKPTDQMEFGAALYGLPLAIIVGPLARLAAGRRQQTNQGSVDGFYGGNFDSKVERDRRYGDVYRVEDWGGAFVLRMEFPRELPPTGLRDELGLSDHMPDYDYDLALANRSLTIRGRVIDERVKKLTAVAPSFPPEFTRHIELEAPVRGFKHRYKDKLLEIVLPKSEAAA